MWTYGHYFTQATHGTNLQLGSSRHKMVMVFKRYEDIMAKDKNNQTNKSSDSE